MDLFHGPVDLMLGNCLERLDEIDDDYVDSIVTDPPYGIKFMQKHWDHGVPGVDCWAECLRVAKPGAYMLAFGGTRKVHRLACAIEDAGWEIRDRIMWVFGTGFPKSKDVSKAIDKAAGVERKDTGVKSTCHGGGSSEIFSEHGVKNVTLPATDAAKQWEGWGTALKPAYEPIIMARKPLDGTVAQNVLTHGCGGLNIDGCRVGNEIRHNPSAVSGGLYEGFKRKESQGRWPANFIHDGSEEVVELFPQTKSGAILKRHTHKRGEFDVAGQKDTEYHPPQDWGANEGSAAQFFYCAKATRAERDEGLTSLPVTGGELTNRNDGSAGLESPRAGAGRTSGGINKHPTVKPLALMRYLCRLVTPPDGIILDPFMGSGSTGVAAVKEGFNFMGIELETESYNTACQRILSVVPS